MAACPRAQHINDCFVDNTNQSWRHISFILWLTNMSYDSSSKRRRRAGAILFCFCLSIIAWICIYTSFPFTRLTTVQKIQLLRFDLGIRSVDSNCQKEFEKNARKLSPFFLYPPALAHSRLYLFIFEGWCLKGVHFLLKEKTSLL